MCEVELGDSLEYIHYHDSIEARNEHNNSTFHHCVFDFLLIIET